MKTWPLTALAVVLLAVSLPVDGLPGVGVAVAGGLVAAWSIRLRLQQPRDRDPR